MTPIPLPFFARNPDSTIRMTKGFNYDTLGTTMKKLVTISKLFLVLALLPASAWGLSFSNLELTNTSLSVTIEETITGITPNYGRDMLQIVNPNASAAPGFTLPPSAEATTKNFSGSPSLSSDLEEYGGIFATEAGYNDYVWVIFASDLVAGDSLEGTLTGSWSSSVFDPNAVTSLNFYWGYNGPGPTTGTLLGSASLSAVPDTGSTAALLGVGVVALAFARRRLG